MGVLPALLALALGSIAQAYDPATSWKTLFAPGLRIHYPSGRYELAAAVAVRAQQALAQLSDRLGWVPAGTINIVLDDETDSANGFAEVAPYKLIGLNAAAPDEVSELAAYDNWIYGLVAHELAHVVHIDTVRGLPAFLNGVFGRWFFPNGAQPSWVTEGLATYFESALTSAGRVGSSYFDMMLRMHLLAGEPMGLDDLGGNPIRWPQSTVPYLYGSYFLDYIARRFGEDALRVMSHDYGSRLIPFAVNASIERATGMSYPALYSDFLSELRRRFVAQAQRIEAAGRREGKKLTAWGQQVGPVRAASDGTVYFVHDAKSEHAAIFAYTPDGKRDKVTEVYGGAELALVAGSHRAVVAQAELYGFYRLYGDLFLVDLDSGASERLTFGLRAHSPDVSPDGERLVFVQRRGGQSILRLSPLASPAAGTTLVDLGPLTQVFAPRFSPDGRQVVFSAFAEGMRDLYVVDVEGGEPRRLTFDAALDGSPCFTPDGAWIVFHSDRDGIYDLYALPTATGGPVRRVSRVLGGAFRPEVTPAGDGLLYVSYGSEGFDLARLPWTSPQDLPLAEPARTPRAVPPRPHVVRVGRVDTYSPLATLAPRGWVPTVAVDGFGWHLGAAAAGADAVGLHRWAAAAFVAPEQRFVGFDVAYANRQFHPGLQLDLRRTLAFAAMPYVRNRVAEYVDEEVWQGSVGTSWPLYARREVSLALSTAYELSWHRLRKPLALDPLDTAPQIPAEGRFAAVVLGLRFANTRRYIDSISTAEGVRAGISLRREDALLGSQYASTQVVADLACYVENPWVKRQVLATSLFAGLGTRNYRHRPLFVVSALGWRDPLLDLLSLRLGSGWALRGFGNIALIGDAIVGGSVEYRFPIADLQSGTLTLPYYLRTLHGAVFVDGVAVAAAPVGLPQRQHYSAGGELRLSGSVAYFLPLTLRLGYGHGLGSDNVQRFFLVMGSSF